MSSDAFWAALGSVGTAAALASMGFYLHRRQMVTSETKQALARFSQQVALPSLFFSKIVRCGSADSSDRVVDFDAVEEFSSCFQRTGSLPRRLDLAALASLHLRLRSARGSHRCHILFQNARIAMGQRVCGYSVCQLGCSPNHAVDCHRKESGTTRNRQQHRTEPVSVHLPCGVSYLTVERWRLDPFHGRGTSGKT